MLVKKVLACFLSIGLLSTAVYAKPDKEEKVKKEKKKKKIPYGLQKKLNNGGTLPQGWQKKIQKGEVVEKDVLDNAVIVKNPNIPDIKDTKVYKVQEKIFRVADDTKKIIEIFKQ